MGRKQTMLTIIVLAILLAYGILFVLAAISAVVLVIFFISLWITIVCYYYDFMNWCRTNISGIKNRRDQK